VEGKNLVSVPLKHIFSRQLKLKMLTAVKPRVAIFGYYLYIFYYTVSIGNFDIPEIFLWTLHSLFRLFLVFSLKKKFRFW